MARIFVGKSHLPAFFLSLYKQHVHSIYTMRFSKMQAAGNDYVFVDGREVKTDLPGLAVRVSDRRYGIGSDGLISVTPEDGGVRMRIFNADGSEGMTCGNGMRCAALFAAKRFGMERKKLTVCTPAGINEVVLTDRTPRSARATAKFFGVKVFRQVDEFAEKLAKVGLYVDKDLVFAVDAGNPHAVFFAPVDAAFAAVAARSCGFFKDGANVEVAEIKGGAIIASVDERGSGPTASCGSGAVATAFAAVAGGFLPEGEFIDVIMPGGTLEVKISGQSAFLRSRVYEVFEGEYEI